VGELLRQVLLRNSHARKMIVSVINVINLWGALATPLGFFERVYVVNNIRDSG